VKLFTLIGILMISLCITSCGERTGSYKEPGTQTRNIAKAEEKYQEAVAALAEKTVDKEMVERLLREALDLDLYHGAAHNNLGVLFLQRDKLYDAAEEFEWARKLLPGHPEPRVNLAIALERGGKYSEALEAAQAALEVRPGNLSAIKTIALIQIRERRTDERTLEHLDAIIQRSNDAVWRDWARLHQERLQQGVLKP